MTTGSFRDDRVPPILLVTGAKDCGKTTLVVEMIRHFKARGVPIFALKRASSVASVDQPHTDTGRFSVAGATVIGLTWPGGSYVAQLPFSSRRFERSAGLGELVAIACGLAPSGTRPLIVAEGFSDAPYPRVHVLAPPNRPERFAAGPVLTTWSLGGDVAPVAREVYESLPLLARWSEETRGQAEPRPGASRNVAAVLAGGRGRRLGGQDKWHLDVAGTPQWARCLGRLREVFTQAFVVGRVGPDALAARGPGTPETARGPGEVEAMRCVAAGLGVSSLPDAVPGAGPLGGLLAALESAAGRNVAAFAGDMPFLNPGLMRHLLFEGERRAGTFDVLLPVWEDARGRFAEPLHALYAPGCLRGLQSLFAAPGTQAGLRLTEAFADLRVHRIADPEIRLFGDPRVLFHNLNTLEDLARARELAARI